jgi:hypothetical protein
LAFISAADRIIAITTAIGTIGFVIAMNIAMNGARGIFATAIHSGAMGIALPFAIAIEARKPLF